MNQVEGHLSRRSFLQMLPRVFGAALLPFSPLAADFYFRRANPDSNQVIFTFDDGWIPQQVETAIEQLVRLQIPADFFPVGRVMEQNLNLWKEAADAGFELHNHTYNHADLSSPLTNVADEILGWETAYAQLGLGAGPNPKVLRLPQNRGEGDLWLYDRAASLDYAGIAGWAVDSRGYIPSWGPTEVQQHISRQLVPGAILLFHFIADDIKALPEIVDTVYQAGLEPVSLARAVGLPTFTPQPPPPSPHLQG
ncbi:MAG: polysaccharide deacetylase family protein [bacterium]|nr:polysaccharide deacetylase family protein [bacterium]